MTRPSFDNTFLDMAEVMSRRSTCLRRRFCAVIVKDNVPISFGYNGAPRGEIDCLERNICNRNLNDVPAGERYEMCQAVHGECNSILNAARMGSASIVGTTMYIYGYDINKNEEICAVNPCKICAKIIQNSGIKEVIGRNPLTRDIVKWDFHTTY